MGAGGSTGSYDLDENEEIQDEELENLPEGVKAKLKKYAESQNTHIEYLKKQREKSEAEWGMHYCFLLLSLSLSSLQVITVTSVAVTRPFILSPLLR